MDKIGNTAILCFSMGKGGMEIDSVRLAEKLSPYGKLYVGCKNKSYIRERILKDKKISSLISVKSCDFRSHFSFRLIFFIRDLVFTENIKNIIFFGTSEIKSIYFGLIGKGVNVIIRHGTTMSHSKKDWFHTWMYSCVNWHVVISNHLKRNVRNIFPISSSSKIKLIYPSFQYSEKTEISHEKTNKIIKVVHVGRIARGKGQDDAIQACQILYENNIPFNLYLIGNFDEEEYLRELKNTSLLTNYKDRIKFLGHVENIISKLQDYDVFLYPTSGEGFGNVLAESLGCGLVCIAYDNTTIPEIFSLGFYGHAVENRNEIELHKTLYDVCSKIKYEKEKSIENIGLARKLFRKEREVQEYLEILE